MHFLSLNGHYIFLLIHGFLLFDVFTEQDSSLERLLHESELLEKAYEHYFDRKIINNDIEETIQILRHSLDEVSLTPQWVPVSWVY